MKREGKDFWEGDPWVVNYLWTELTAESIYSIVEGARIGQKYLKDIAKIYGKAAKWKAPLYDFPVFQPSYTRKARRVKTPFGSLQLYYGDTVYDNRKQLSSIAANYIHSLDASLLMYCVDNATNSIGVIHDCFLIHPNDGDEIRDNYKEGYVRIFKSNPLEQISKELDKDGMIEIPKIGTLDLNEVYGAKYIIS